MLYLPQLLPERSASPVVPTSLAVAVRPSVEAALDDGTSPPRTYSCASWSTQPCWVR